MRLKDLRERVKGGKLDPLSKMGKSKLTGQEVATYYRKNPKAKQAARDPMVKKAIELALDLGGNQTLAVKEIEKVKKGLSKNSAVMSALRTANEDMTSTSSVAMPEIPLGKVLKRKKDLDEETLVEKKVKYQTDFGKNRMGTPADAYAEYTKYVTKKFGIKIIKTPNPKSKNHLTFEAPLKNMKQFQQFLKKNLIHKAVEYMQAKIAGEPYNEQSMAGFNLKRLDTVKPGVYKHSKNLDKKHVGDKNLDPLMGIFTVNFDGGTPGIEKTDMTKVFKLAKKYKLDVLKPLPARRRSENEFVFQQIDVGNGMEKFRKDVMRISGSRIGIKEEKLSPAKAQYKKFNIMKTQLYRFVKAKTKAHKFGIDDLMLMTSPKVIEGMYKRNPQGFTRMLDKMYPNEKGKLDKGDFTVLGDFIDARGKVIKGKGDTVDESTSLNEETILYRVKDIQKPELDKFKSSARLMKLKINIKQSPRGKETIIRLEGGKKQIRDFDAVARGKSSYGDPSIVEDAVERAKETADLKDKHTSEKEQLKTKHEREKEQEKSEIDATKAESFLAQLNSLEEQIDLIEQSLLMEKQFRLNPNKKPSLFTQWYSKKNQKDKRTRNMSKSMYSPEDVLEYHWKAGNLKAGKNIVKDTGASVLARSLGKIMNDERKKSRDKGAEFGKGDPKDEMDAPKIKKIIDTIAKGLIINVTRKGKDGVSFTFDKKQGDLFYNLDTYTRDIVWDVMQMGSDGTFYQSVYGEPEGRKLDLKFTDDDDTDNIKLRSPKVDVTAQTESFNLNEESATMKKVRDVIKKKGMMNIDGMKLDLTTASMIASVYDKVNPTNKKRMDSLKLPQLVNLTMKVAGKTRKESTNLPFSERILESLKRVNPDGRRGTDFIKVPKLTSIEQGKLNKIKKRFPTLPEPIVYDIMKVTHKGNKVDSRKFVEIGNAYDKDYRGKGGNAGNFISLLRKMGVRVPSPDYGEAVSPAQQAAIAISKKERGEKPKDKTDECADEKDFKPHMMYDPKTGKGVMANKYADHVRLDKMGYTHEKPKSEALDAKDKPFIKDLISKLRGGSKTHAKQADDLEKAMKTENRAKRDAMKDMGKRKDKDDDGYGTATDDDRKAADKNVIMQIRRVADLPKGGQIELPNGKKVKMDRKSAIALNKKFDSISKPQDKLKLQNMMNDKKISVVALKRLLGK